jgi:hypothetical protein
MTTKSQELEKLQAVLTARLQADVRAWYGAHASVIEPSSFDTRNWSFFFRYPVQILKEEPKIILVKIRRREKMRLEEAVVSNEIRNECRGEYESLIKIRDVFTRCDESSLFFTIRPLICYEELNAIVMEEAKIRSLKAHFHSPSMWVDGNHRRHFEKYMNLAGRWLRVFHDCNGSVDDGPFFRESIYQEVHEKLIKIEYYSESLNMTFAKALVDDLYGKYKYKVLPYGILHNDFSAANIFMTEDEKLCSFDPHNKYGTIYIDVAKLMVDLETSKLQLLGRGLHVPRLRMRAFGKSLLEGYFGTSPVNAFALNLFRLIHLIRKWEGVESRFKDTSGGSRIFYSPVITQARSSLLKLLREQADKQNYDL